MTKVVLVVVITALMSAWLCPASPADAFNVTVTTAPIQGVPGFVIFDFIGGSPLFNNNATVSGFTTNAILGGATTSGAVSGTLTPGPLVLSDTAFLSEWNQSATFGTAMSFQLTLDTNFVLGGIPDEFSFFLEDSTGTPFATSDPTGADALFVVDITGSPLTPQVFTSSSASANVTLVSTVPESPTLCLMLYSIGFAGTLAKKRLTQTKA